MKMDYKECKHCGVGFETKYAHQVFCSKKCNANHYARSKKGKAGSQKYYKENYKPVERKVHLKRCPHCGENFDTIHSFKKFCSKQCKDTFRNRSEAGRGSSRRYRRTEGAREKYKVRAQTSEYKEARKEFDKKWTEHNRKKVDAYVKARKIPLEPCLICGTEDNIHRHHFDYDKPLEVVFLCGRHHKEYHRISEPCDEELIGSIIG